MKTKEGLILSFIIIMTCFFARSNDNLVMGEEFNLTKIGQFDECSFAFDVQVIDNIAYIADAGDGLWILDVSNSSNPTVLSHTLIGRVEHWVYVEDNIAFVADYFNGLIIFDVSNPNNPQQIGQFANGNEIFAVVRNDDIACIGDPFLSILNISDLTHPTEIYRDDDFPVIDLIIKDDILFCLDVFQGLTILNISNPTAPVEINQWFTSSIMYRDIEILDDVIFMASSIGLKALNISPLTNLQDLGVDSSGNAIRCLEIKNSLLYISEPDVGLVIFNITDLESCEEAGLYTEDGIIINSIFVSNNIIYATAESDGLIIIGNESSDSTNEAYSAPFFIGLISLTIICSKVLKKKANETTKIELKKS